MPLSELYATNRIGALEKLIRSYPEKPALGMMFDSLGEAYDFVGAWFRYPVWEEQT